MTRDQFMRGWRRVNYGILFAGLAAAGMMAVLGLMGLRYNDTPSVPEGLYWVTSDPGAAYVSFCLTGPWAEPSLRRGYRGYSVACPDGGEPLLKPVVGHPGDHILMTPEGSYLNGKVLINTSPHNLDRHGRALWILLPYGEYVVQPEQQWVFSSYSADSFDSRYFGPIPTASIRHRLKPILTW